jgi:hypothetical protein
MNKTLMFTDGSGYRLYKEGKSFFAFKKKNDWHNTEFFVNTDDVFWCRENEIWDSVEYEVRNIDSVIFFIEDKEKTPL